jgi:hypothetical protein
MKLDRAVLFDARLTDIDPLAKVNGDRARAARECTAFGPPGSCGYHDDFLEAGLKNGFNVFLQGIVHNKDAHGAPLPDTLMTESGTLKDPITGLETITTPSGAITPSATYLEIMYSDEGAQILNERVRAAKQKQ